MFMLGSSPPLIDNAYIYIYMFSGTQVVQPECLAQMNCLGWLALLQSLQDGGKPMMKMMKKRRRIKGLLALSLCQVSDSVLLVLHASAKLSLAYN